MYEIGYHSSDEHYCHVSWVSDAGRTDLFDVALYGNPGEPQDAHDRQRSLDALNHLLARANRAKLAEEIELDERDRRIEYAEDGDGVVVTVQVALGTHGKSGGFTVDGLERVLKEATGRMTRSIPESLTIVHVQEADGKTIYEL